MSHALTYAGRRAILWVALVLASAGALAAEDCATGRLSIRGDWGRAHFSVELAQTPTERAHGLMYVEQMPVMAGMLFVYERPQPVSFWMRNTLIPLDMIFADSSGTVTRVHSMARPLDETPIPGGTQVQYVLEINGGLAARLGIGPGDVLRHPVIAEPAWGCDAAQ